MANFSYIHIPFCSSKCKYCAFTSFVNSNYIEDYIKALSIQIKKEYNLEKQKTLYFGGGTPSLLNIGQIESILGLFNFEENAEITFELNPENCDYNYLKALFELKINRLSIGAQTFNDKILADIGRRHNSKDIISAVQNAKKAGFKNISIDLMYGLPNQNEFDFIQTIDEAIKLDIEHISTYGLKIEENSIYGKKLPDNLPDEDFQADMYEILIEKLEHFNHYEISNFAKSEKFISKHNTNYWKVQPYYGFGAGASGFCRNTRYKNSSSLKKYLENPHLKEEEIKLTKENILEEKIFLGFRMAEGINVVELNKEFNIDFNEKYNFILQKYINTGHITKTKNGYALTKAGILVSNFILSEFLC